MTDPTKALLAEIAELKGRSIALEVFSVAALGLYIANSRNDPGFEKARALLDFLRQTAAQEANALDPEARAAALHHADDLASRVLENLRLLHGGSDPSRP